MIAAGPFAVRACPFDFPFANRKMFAMAVLRSWWP